MCIRDSSCPAVVHFFSPVKQVLVGFNPATVQIAFPASFGLLGVNGYHTNSVSYTHLDVYKRQPFPLKKMRYTAREAIMLPNMLNEEMTAAWPQK